jgi:predicted  nucleic acid-binding Zn-ribbon protein
MKLFRALLVAGQALLSSSNAVDGSPLETVVKLITQLQSTVVQDGENEDRAYKKFVAWCDDAVGQKDVEIKGGKKSVDKLNAAIADAKSRIDNCNTEIEKFSSDISTNEKDLEAATAQREKESADFKAAEQELEESIDMLGRAADVLQKEMAKGASFMQGKANTAMLERSLTGISAIVDAVGVFTEQDKDKLMSLLQDREDADDAMDEAGAPDAAKYEGHSNPIIDVIEDMKDKASQSLNKLRGEERTAQHNYEMVKQNLEMTIADGNKELDEEKASLADSNEAKATAEGALAVASKQLREAERTREEFQDDCIAKASDRETTMQGRKEELAMLAKSKKIIQAAMVGLQTSSSADSQPSFLQLGSRSKAKARAKFSAKVQEMGTEVVHMVRRVAHAQHSKMLSKLSSRIEALLKLGLGYGEDPFKKIKQMISTMIKKLEDEAAAEATEKAYCDKEMAETGTKQDALIDESDGLKAKIDEAAAESAQLKEEVTVLQEELAELAAIQKEMDDTRAVVKANVNLSVNSLTKGIEGVRGAMDLLREFYNAEEGEALVQTSSATAALSDSTDSDADVDNDPVDNLKEDDNSDSDADFDAVMQQKKALSFLQQPAAPEKFKKSGGAGTGIIALLEVIESDLGKNLAQVQAEDAERAQKYQAETEENKISKAEKEQDVKLKTAGFKGLDKSISEMESDHSTVSAELDAVNDFFSKLKERCVAKPDTYAEKKKRRDAEIKGLQEALELLANEAALMQVRQGLV